MMLRIAAVLLACLSIAAPAAAQRRTRLSAAERAELQARMKRFVETVLDQRPDSVARFFARSGDLTWVHTLHRDDGTRTGVWRFPAADLPRALKYDGPLWASFALQPEGQPIGLFYHQVMSRQAFARRKGWRRVGTRFVPAGEPASAGLFVEWRREGGEWVAAAYGDEGYGGGKLPAWCC